MSHLPETAQPAKRGANIDTSAGTQWKTQPGKLQLGLAPFGLPSGGTGIHLAHLEELQGSVQEQLEQGRMAAAGTLQIVPHKLPHEPAVEETTGRKQQNSSKGRSHCRKSWNLEWCV